MAQKLDKKKKRSNKILICVNDELMDILRERAKENGNIPLGTLCFMMVNNAARKPTKEG